MMETNFTLNVRMIRFLSLIMLGFFSIIHTTIQAQVPSCVCKGAPLNVVLGSDGTATITPEMVLSSTSTCGGLLGTVTVMTSKDGGVIPTSPTINCSYIGKTLYAKYTNAGNSCWTELRPIEDKLPPTIVCPGDMTISCAAMEAFKPTVSDNASTCGPTSYRIVSEITKPCSGTSPTNDTLKTVVRQYIATDASGNVSAPCTFTFYVKAISVDSIVFPPNLDIAPGANEPLACDSLYAKLAADKDNPSPKDIGTLKGSGAPVLKIGGGLTRPLLDNPDLPCGLLVSYSDAPIITLHCVKKLIRTWTVMEWSCRNIAPITRMQIIEIVDNKGPRIVPAADIVASTSNHNCEGVVTFPNANATDNCGSTRFDVTVYLNGNYEAPGAYLSTRPYTTSLPIGQHKAIYAVYDNCNNVSRDTIDVIVEDNTPPVVICDELATIAINSKGEAWVPATVFDDGSYDECKLGKLLVRRMTANRCDTCENPEFPGFKLIGVRGSGTSKRLYYLSQHSALPKVAQKTAVAMGGYLVQYANSTERSDVRNFVDASIPEVKFFIGGTSGVQKDTSRASGLFPTAALLTDTLRYVVEIENPCGFSSHVQFCCADVNANPNDMVVLRAIDASGNFNDCMVSVVVQNKLTPTITCPGDRTVDCDFAFDQNNLRKDFGWPTAYDNCGPRDVILLDSTNQTTGCRISKIVRRFAIRGGRASDTCRQEITFRPKASEIYNGPADNQWPRSPYMVTGCGSASELSPDVTGRPILSDGVCSLVGADYVDQQFNFNNASSPACLKILRTWTVIDWCKFAPNKDENGDMYPNKKTERVNTWYFTQEIKVIDNVAPVFAPLASTISADTYDGNCEKGTITLSAKAKDSCTKVLRGTISVDSLNNGSIDKVYNIVPTVDSRDSNSISTTLTYPVGTHKVIYSFEDKCGNVTSKEQIFKIINKKAPNAIVIQGLAVNLMKVGPNQGMVDIWASDFDKDKKSNHPCYRNIIYSFTEVTKHPTTGLPVTTPNLVFDCSDLGKNDVTIWVAAVTSSGDIVQSSVNTFIDVQDNPDASGARICSLAPGRVAISGNLATESNHTVQNVTIMLNGSELQTLTGSNGKFNFSNMPLGGKYEVVPIKNDDAMNGISTLDLVMIQKHILGIEKLNSPYKLIAADVNKDGKVTAADLIELRKLILGTVNTFTNNRSWRFVDKTHKFADNTNAQGEAFPEIYPINKLTSDMVTDFVAIKTGDINGSASASNLSNNVESRSARSLSLTTENQNFVAGQKIVIPIKATSVSDITGMQFTLDFDQNALSLASIEAAAIEVNEGNFGYKNTTEGQLTMSWNDSKAVNLNKGETLFNLTFTANENGQLAEALKINSAVTNAEAYSAENEIMNVTLNVENRDKDMLRYELKQNTPNPFKESTFIGFELPQDMPATINVYDISGKLMRSNNIQGVKGLNRIEITKSELPAGVLYYTLKAGEYTATKKMVLIE